MALSTKAPGFYETKSCDSFVSEPTLFDICTKLVTIRNGRKEGMDYLKAPTSSSGPSFASGTFKSCKASYHWKGSTSLVWIDVLSENIVRTISSSYVVTDNPVSGIHCKIYAVRSPNGGVVISCQDVSRNGLYLNGHHIKKTCIILMDRDILTLPHSITFTCIHVWKNNWNKMTLFDSSQPTSKRIGEYIITPHCLGSGSFATVHLAFDPFKHRQVACKSIRIKHENDLGQVMREVKILMAIQHPNINHIYGTQTDKNFIHIFLKLCTGGDLFNYISSHPSMTHRLCEAEAKYVMFQLLKGLKYLHDNMISHRDLKPENILLSAPGPYPQIQIADFGLARPNAYQETFNTAKIWVMLGILCFNSFYISVLVTKACSSIPADCWSAGIILFVMLSGSHPFDTGRSSETSSDWFSHIRKSRTVDNSLCPREYLQTESRLKDRIMDSRVNFPSHPWVELVDAKCLIETLLIHNYLLRATVDSALQSRWFTYHLEQLERLYRERINHESDTA